MELTNTEKTHKFYDTHLGDIVPLDTSPWKVMYLEAFNMIPKPRTGLKILDLGCGAGRFAFLLKRHAITKYLGIDFSSARIERSKAYVPDFEFKCLNMKSTECKKLFPGYDIFFLLETLEHIRMDTAVLRSIPKDKIIIFSVPTYAGESHVRFFTSIEEAAGRYGQMITFIKAVILFMNNGKRIFLFHGVRNEF